MASPIEEIIEDLEEYIDSCRASAFSAQKIVINRDEIEGYISELKGKIPEELSRYKKIISQKEEILNDAKRQAKDIISAAQIHTNELVSEHQIMQQAYAKGNEVVAIATKDAQNTLDSAYREANEIRTNAIAYADDLLMRIQAVLANSIETTRVSQNTYIETMQGYLEIVNENRSQLAPNQIANEIINGTAEYEEPNKTGHTGKIEIPKSVSQKTGPIVSGHTGPLVSGNTGPIGDMVNTIDGNEVPPEIAGTGVIDIPDSFFKK